MVQTEESHSQPEVIVIGASAGGVTAIQRIIRSLTSSVRSPIVVVQHLAKYARTELPLVYIAGDGRPVIEVEDKMPLERGRIYFAVPDYHLLFEKDRSFALSQDDPIHFSRPSIDVTFESAAHIFGSGAMGILLTGANRDGAQGLCKIRDRGGRVIVQDPGEAEVAIMPQAAVNLCGPERVLALDRISDYLNALTGERI